MIGACTRGSRQAHHGHGEPGERQDGEVGRHHAEPWLLAGTHQPQRQAMLENEQIERSQAEHDDRVALQAIERAAPGRPALIFAHRQRADVARAPPVEIAGGGVVHGMGAPPVAVGCQGQHADHPAEPVVGAPPAEKRAVPAIVLDHEQAHEEARGGNREQQAEPVRVAQAKQHREPQGHERHHADDELGQAAAGARLPVGCQHHHPVTRVRLGRSAGPTVPTGMLDRLLHRAPPVTNCGDAYPLPSRAGPANCRTDPAARHTDALVLRGSFSTRQL